MQAGILTYWHIYMTGIHACIQSGTHIRTLRHTHSQADIYIQAEPHTGSHNIRLTHIHTYMKIHMIMHTGHTHLHTYIHTYIHHAYIRTGRTRDWLAV